MSALTALYRRLQLFRHRPRHWLLRRDTIDARLFREVVIDNAYQLPPRFGPGDVILDVGAHIGSFAYAVLRRGAGSVYCCEAEPDNFRLLQHNLQPYERKTELIPRAIWRSDRIVHRLHFQPGHDERNTGAGGVSGCATGRIVPALAFDDLIRHVTRGGRRVRLLKLDCEGSEWPILFTSRTLHLVEGIGGEYHLRTYEEPFAVPGYTEFSPAVLERYLTGQGFRVQVQPIATEPRLGLFFATRPGQALAA